MISVRGLTRRFGARTVVDDVSLDVSRGEIVALLGPNGAGKTTTMRMMAGLIGMTRGTVSIDGIALSRDTASHLRRRIGFLTESPGLWDRLTVRENLRVYAELYGLADGERAIDAALARALLHEPPALLLDEPTSGLDPEIRRTVRQLLESRRAAGCAILVSTHNLDEAERLADRVAVLQTRLLALDRPADLRRRLTTGRLIVRTVEEPRNYLDTARAFDAGASIDGEALVVSLGDVDASTPALVRQLVAAGAEIIEVRPEMPALEDVYLHLVGSRKVDVA